MSAQPAPPPPAAAAAAGFLSGEDSLKLSRMVSETGAADNTAAIRSLKHSVLLRGEIDKLEALKGAEAEMRARDPDAFTELARLRCYDLYRAYPDIFRRVLKDELDLRIMARVLDVLRMIEDASIDQHEGSVLVGRLLKELYVDSAGRGALNAETAAAAAAADGEPATPLNAGERISWLEFKQQQRASSP